MTSFVRSKQTTHDFDEFLNGNTEALTDVLMAESSYLFDFSMRMTGQLGRSSEVTDEVLQSMEHSVGDVETLNELLVKCYKTLRTFASDIWNAETKKLENPAYSGVQGKEVAKIAKIEVKIRSLPPRPREVLLLRELYGFSEDNIVEIIGNTSNDEVQQAYRDARAAVEGSVGLDGDSVSALMKRISLFKRPERDGPETQNLSVIMNDFRKTEKMHSSRMQKIRFLIYGVLISSAWFYRGVWVEKLKEIIVPLFD